MSKKNKQEVEELNPKSGKKKFIIILIFCILALGVGAFLGTSYYLKSTGEEKPIEQVYFDIGDITVNVDNESAVKHYAKITLSVGYDKKNKALATELEEKKSSLIDKAIFYFKSLKYEEFSYENEEKLKEFLKAEIDNVLNEGKIESVVFTNLIVQ